MVRSWGRALPRRRASGRQGSTLINRGVGDVTPSPRRLVPLPRSGLPRAGLAVTRQIDWAGRRRKKEKRCNEGSGADAAACRVLTSSEAQVETDKQRHPCPCAWAG